MKTTEESKLKSEIPRVSVWQIAVTQGLQAAKRNRIPAIVLWLFGTSIVAGYFFVEPVRQACDSIGQVKQTYGLTFSMLSTALFGGLIPTLIVQQSRRRTAPIDVGLITASTLLWAFKGIEIDLFYKFQAWMFGEALNFQTIAVKTICDQLVMVPIFGMVNVVLFFVWRDCGYSFKKLFAELKPGWYGKLVLPVLIANWMIWIPAVAMIYCLPISLQLPVQNLILCFWVLILMFFTSKNTPDHSNESEKEPCTKAQDSVSTAG